MQRRFLFQLLLIVLGSAFLLSGFFLDKGTATAQTMPTPNRLAQPTLPIEPSQADRGAQVYWLTCLPCHGDRGQGLTEEFKLTYPEEDRNCWTSGCHGNRPYEDGFTLPQLVPPLIGAGTLQKFTDALALRSYIFAAMPYWRPASLTADEAWQVTAFLLRENKLLANGEDLTEANAAALLIDAPQPPTKPQPSPVLLLLLVGFMTLTPLFLLLRIFRKK